MLLSIIWVLLNTLLIYLTLDVNVNIVFLVLLFNLLYVVVCLYNNKKFKPQLIKVITLCLSFILILPSAYLIFNIDRTNYQYVIHAGGGLDGKSYLNCKEGVIHYTENYNLIELDFLLTSDNKIVCSHDFNNLQNYSLTNKPTFEQIQNIKLFDKYTILTFEDLIDFLKINTSVKIIFDTKEEDVENIVNLMVDYCNLVNFNIKNRFIIQVYSYENYIKLKSLNFNEYWFTNYKAEYTIKEITNYFEDKQNVTTIVLPLTTWQLYKMFNFRTSKKIAVHTTSNKAYINFLVNHGVDYVYVDFI